MTDQSSASDTGRQQKQALAAWLEAGSPATSSRSPEELLKLTLPPISDELEQLLWLYADDLTSADQEERLWELAAEEPAARAHLQRIYAAEELVSRSGADDLSGSRPGRSSQSVAQSWPDSTALTGLPGVKVSFAENQLNMTRRSGQAVAGQFAMARSAGEPITRMSDEQTLACGTLKIDVSRRSSGTFDVSLSLSHLTSDASHGSPAVQLLSNATIVAESPLTDGRVQFRDVEPNCYVAIIVSDDEVIDRFVIDIETL